MVQEEARSVLQLFRNKMHVQDVQVHYTDTISNCVHVYLLPTSNDDVQSLQTLAKDIQTILVDSSNIITDANIYLKLLSNQLTIKPNNSNEPMDTLLKTQSILEKIRYQLNIDAVRKEASEN